MEDVFKLMESTEIFYMKLHTLWVSTEKLKSKWIWLESKGDHDWSWQQKCQQEFWFGYLLTTGVKTFYKFKKS